MPKFSTISPTCQPGGKPAAWERFRDGNYVAIGWCYETDLTGWSIEEVMELIPGTSSNEHDQQDGEHSFPIFWQLRPGDYLAVHNNRYGLFGVGRITSPYRYDRYKHPTGEDGHYYPHYYEMEWIRTEYIHRDTLDFGDGPAWTPYGTLSQLHDDLPLYILPYVMPLTTHIAVRRSASRVP